MTDEGLAAFVKRFKIPIPEEAAKNGTPYRPPQDSPEMVYLQERRRTLGGYMPSAIGAGELDQGSGVEDFQGVAGRIEGARGFDDDGFVIDADGPC